MIIGVVLDDGLDKPDGVQQCVLMLGEWLRQQGHEVHYLVGQTSRTDLENVHVLAKNLPVVFNGNRLTIPLPSSGKLIKQALQDIQPDVLHVHVPYSPFMGAKVIKYSAVQTGVVGTFHILPYGTVPRWATRILGLWLRPTLRRFAVMKAATPAAAEFSEWSLRIPTSVLQHAINIKPFQAVSKPKPNLKLAIVFLGRLVPRKGAYELVQAIAALSPEVQDRIHVRIGGRGPLLDTIKAAIHEHNLASTIQLDGFIEEAKKPSYLAQADIAIFPSTAGESFGISLIEAMAARAGVVMGGDNPGYQGVIGEWPEAICTPRNTIAFAEQLTQLITDSDLRQRLHAAQQAAVPKYDIETIGKQWLSIYEAAIRQAKAK